MSTTYKEIVTPLWFDQNVARIRREHKEREHRDLVAELHSTVDFVGLTWVIKREHARALSREDVAWLDEQWSFVDREVTKVVDL